MYTRARTIPVNPQTSRQVIIRNLMASFSAKWTDTLTQAQRDLWDVYAQTVLVTNRLGDQVQISGQNHYCRANVSRAQANEELALTPALSEISVPGTTLLLPSLGMVSGDVDATGQDVVFDDTPAWVDNAENALLIYSGKPRTVGRKYFRGPYRLVGIIRGDVTTPPTSPTAVAFDTWGQAAGQMMKMRYRLSVGAPGTAALGLSGTVYFDSEVT